MQQSASSPSAPDTAPQAATWSFLWRHPAHVLGLGLGSGLSPMAPGTMGTLCGWALFAVLRLLLPIWAQGTAVAAAIALGWWVCTVTARNLRQPDPGSIVWDEIAAFWLVLWLLSPSATRSIAWVGGWQQAVVEVVAFALFRYFDAAKPGPVRWADSIFKGTGWRGGCGIMFDDLVAAFCTLLALALALHVMQLVMQ